MNIWSSEAEQSLLGALLMDCGRVFDKANLDRRDFFSAEHGDIFSAIEYLHRNGKPVDVITVVSLLKDRGQDESCGGLVYLNSLASGAFSTSGASRYAEVVREKSRLRALLATLDQAHEIANGQDAMAARLDQITSLFLGLQKDQIVKAPKSMAEIALKRTQHYEDLESGRVTPGWPTDLSTLNTMLNGGLKPGMLYILAARPAVGKSSLSLSIGMTQAKAGRKVLFLSQEMGEDEVADRGVSISGRIDYGALLTGKMSGDDWHRAAEVLGADELKNLYIDDQPALKLMDVRAKAKQIPNLSVLILDYLQLCSGSGDNRNAEIEQISRGLKALAKELNIAVIALSQLNRQVETRSNKRPMLSDLRDSGSIEQDADVVMFLWPSREFSDGSKLIGLAIDKNRQGRCGKVALHFQGKFQSWAQSTESLDEPVSKFSRGFDD